MGSGKTGKLSCAWVGAWVVHGMVDGCLGGGGGDVWWGWGNCMCILPVRLDLSIGGGLDGDCEEVIGVTFNIVANCLKNPKRPASEQF